MLVFAQAFAQEISYMVTGSFLAATERLLAALRADGCTVAAEGDRLIVEGALTDAKRAAISARKPELLALLAIETASIGDDAVDPPLTARETAPRSLLAGFAVEVVAEAAVAPLPHGPVVPDQEAGSGV